MSFGLAALLSLAAASFDAQWAASLAPNSAVELPAGVYAGPWRLAPGIHVTAGLGAVLEGSAGADAALTLTGAARIEGLRIEVAPGAYGIRVERDKVELIGVHLNADRPAKAAIYVAHGEVAMTGGQIEGLADYGVLAQQARRVTLTGVAIHGVRAGAAAVSGPTVIDNCAFTGPFSEAAISLIQVAEARLIRNRLSAVKTMGIKLTNSTATLSENRVTGARADAQGLEGNSLYAEASNVTLAGDQLGDASSASEGPVIMLLHSTARLDGVRVEGGLETLVYLAEGSKLTASGSELHGGRVGLTVEDGSSASERGFQFVDVTRPLLKLAR